MKLFDAVVMGRFCGLRTVEECIKNIEMHAMSLFKYEHIPSELKALHEEYIAWKKGDLFLDEEAVQMQVDKQMEAYEDWYAEQEQFDMEDFSDIA